MATITLLFFLSLFLVVVVGFSKTLLRPNLHAIRPKRKGLQSKMAPQMAATVLGSSVFVLSLLVVPVYSFIICVFSCCCHSVAL